MKLVTSKRLFVFMVAYAMQFCAFASPLHAKDQSDKIDYASLKAEARSKYKLPPKAKKTSEQEDTRAIVTKLEAILKTKRASEVKAFESPELTMNRKMEITFLEYAIDHLSETVPELKAKQIQIRKVALEKAKKERTKENYVDPTMSRIKIW